MTEHGLLDTSLIVLGCVLLVYVGSAVVIGLIVYGFRPWVRIMRWWAGL